MMKPKSVSTKQIYDLHLFEPVKTSCVSMAREINYCTKCFLFLGNQFVSFTKWLSICHKMRLNCFYRLFLFNFDLVFFSLLFTLIAARCNVTDKAILHRH